MRRNEKKKKRKRKKEEKKEEKRIKGKEHKFIRLSTARLKLLCATGLWGPSLLLMHFSAIFVCPRQTVLSPPFLQPSVPQFLFSFIPVPVFCYALCGDTDADVLVDVDLGVYMCVCVCWKGGGGKGGMRSCKSTSSRLQIHLKRTNHTKA